MPKKSMDDFAATLGAQLRAAGEQMRTMRKPPVHAAKAPSSDETDVLAPPGVTDSLDPSLAVDDCTTVSPSSVKPLRAGGVSAPQAREAAIPPPDPTPDPATDTHEAAVRVSLEAASQVPLPSSAENGPMPCDGTQQSSMATDCHEKSSVGQKTDYPSEFSSTEAASAVTGTAHIVINSHEPSPLPESATATPYARTDNNGQRQSPRTASLQCHKGESATPARSGASLEAAPRIASQTGSFLQDAIPDDNQQLSSTDPNATLYRDESFPLQSSVADRQTSFSEQLAGQPGRRCATTDSHGQSFLNKEQDRPKAWGRATAEELAGAAITGAAIGGARQIVLDALDHLRQETPSRVVVNLKRLASALGLSYGTVRNVMSRLAHEGAIYTTQVRTGNMHGVCVEFPEARPLQSVTAVMPPSLTPPRPETVTTSRAETGSPGVPGNAAGRKNAAADAVWDTTDDDISLLWPQARAAGFGAAHLQALRRAYLLQGWNGGNVARCLRYLDWELTEGGDPPPAERLTRWMALMRRQGHYPTPEGYVDPEVLRRQQEMEAERQRTNHPAVSR